jgi:hypothetical protein
MYKKSVVSAPFRTIVALLGIIVFSFVSFYVVSSVLNAYTVNTATSQFNAFVDPIRKVCTSGGSEVVNDLSLGGFGEQGTYAIVQLDVSGDGETDLKNAAAGKARSTTNGGYRTITDEEINTYPALKGKLQKCSGGTCLCLLRLPESVTDFKDTSFATLAGSFWNAYSSDKGGYALGNDRDSNLMGFGADILGGVESMQACQSKGSCLPPWMYEPMRTDWVQQLVLGFAVTTVTNFIRSSICSAVIMDACSSASDIYWVATGALQFAQLAVQLADPFIGNSIPDSLKTFLNVMNDPLEVDLLAVGSCAAGCLISVQEATCAGPHYGICMALLIGACSGLLIGCYTVLQFDIPTTWYYAYPQYIIDSSMDSKSLQWGWDGEDSSFSYDYGAVEDVNMFSLGGAEAGLAQYNAIIDLALGNTNSHELEFSDPANFGAGFHFGATCDKDELSFEENCRGLTCYITDAFRAVVRLFSSAIDLGIPHYLSVSDIEYARDNNIGLTDINCDKRKDGCVPFQLASDNCNSNGRKEGLGFMLSQRRYSNKYAFSTNTLLGDLIPRNWRIELYNKDDYMLKDVDIVDCIRMDELGCDANQKIVVTRNSEYFSAATYLNLGQAYSLKGGKLTKWMNTFKALMTISRCTSLQPYKMGTDINSPEAVVMDPGSGFLSCMALMGLDPKNPTVISVVPEVKYFQAWIGGNDPYGVLGVNSYISSMIVSKFHTGDYINDFKASEGVSSHPYASQYADYDGKIVLKINGRLS